jgi:hypothetical protein
MNAFNRGFMGLLALGWIAVLGAAIWLVWDQSRLFEIDTSAIKLNFDLIADTQAEKVLATIIAGALMLPALLLLGFEMKPSRRRDTAVQTANGSDDRKMQNRIDSLERDLANERARNDNVRDRGDKPVTTGNRRWHLFPRH